MAQKTLGAQTIVKMHCPNCGVLSVGYREYGLDFLIGEKFRRVSFRANPLLFLLCIVDTLDPYKNFHKCAFGCGIDEIEYSWERMADIYKKVEIDVQNHKIIVTVPQEWGAEFERHLQGVMDWMAIDFSKSGNLFIISVL